MLSYTSMCGFPGNRFLRIAKRYLMTLESYKAKMGELKTKGWFTDYNLRHKFTRLVIRPSCQLLLLPFIKYTSMSTKKLYPKKPLQETSVYILFQISE